MTHYDASTPVITLRLLQQLQSSGNRFKTADSTGVKLTSRDLLIRTLALRRYLLREVLDADEKRVGIFLPPTVPAVATNLAVSLADRVAVNLNYTVNSALLKQCCDKAGLKRVITSRKFIEKVGLDVGRPMIFLEDIRDRITMGDKLAALLNVRLRSANGLHRSLGLSHQQHEDPVTIIFTSGSTGVPKGVVLSSKNITSNIVGITDTINLNADDVVLGILPFFHSFGYTIALWAGMSLPCSVVYHYSPLEARPIAKLAEDYRTTVLLATPTFLRSYLRRIEPEQFKSLNIVVLGAEKMPLGLADEYEEKFGLRPTEGYGTTELSPLVSVNVPANRASDGTARRAREGSVGLPMTDVEARIVSIDHDTPLATGETGLLEIRGPNVMQGYLDQPELTAEVMHDGWYRTGDVGFLDSDGFIHITGRMSRFSKIGGEMVPHIQIEETLTEIAGLNEDGSLRIAVTAVPDVKRGERLVVLHTELPCAKQELVQKLSQAGLPNLFLPGEDSYIQVEAIPVLGSGKLDLSGMRALAEEKLGQ